MASHTSTQEPAVNRVDVALRFERTRPPAPAHRGEAGPVGVPLEALADPERAPGPARPLDLGGLAPPFELLVFDRAPSALLVAGGEELVVLQGDPVRDPDGGLLFDSDDQPVRVWAGGWLLDADGGAIRIWTVGESAPAADAPSVLPAWPGLEALLGDRRAADWLGRRLTYLEGSADPLDRLVAAGTLCRLWTPVTAEDRAAALADALRGQTQPQGRVRDWLGSVRGWDRIRARLVDRCERWRQQAAGLIDLYTADPARAAVRVEHLVAERDDLASLERVLRLVGQADEATEKALAAVDRAAGIHGALIEDLFVVDLDDPWLATVYRKEPEHWWGALGR